MRTPDRKKRQGAGTDQWDARTVSHIGQGLTSFEELTIQSDCRTIDLSSNRLTSFLGLHQLPSLTHLVVDSNPIVSFQGCQLFPALRWISLRGTPISRNVHCKLMCLVAFGCQIESFNGEKLSQALKKQATLLRAELFCELQKGRVITRLSPLRLLDMAEGQPRPASPPARLVESISKLTYTDPYLRDIVRSMTHRPHLPRPTVATLCHDILEPNPQLTSLRSDLVRKFVGTLLDVRRSVNDPPRAIDDPSFVDCHRIEFATDEQRGRRNSSDCSDRGSEEEEL
jgi:hypothetical protein